MIKKMNKERNFFKNRPLKWRQSKLTIGKRTIIDSEKQWEWNNAEKKGNHSTDHLLRAREEHKIPALGEDYILGGGRNQEQ